MKNIFNSPENKDGSLCKVLISNVVEGISLRRVTQVHVCEPWWNMSEMEQIVARAIRFCSHSDVPNKYVDVYYHASALKSYPKKDPHIAKIVGKSSLAWLTTNQNMYLIANRKQQLNNQFEQAIKESAIDCNLNKFGNIVRLEQVMMHGPLLIENIYYDRTTDSYYSVEKSRNGTHSIKGIDLNYSDKLWPASAFVYNNKDVTQAYIKDSDSIGDSRRASLFGANSVRSSEAASTRSLSIIMPENIKCLNGVRTGGVDSSPRTFEQLFNYAILRGEEPSAWKYCYDSYRKNAILPELILKYNIYEWGVSNTFTECLYNKLLNPAKYNLTKKEEKILENFIIKKNARLNNTQRYKEILANKMDKSMIDSLNYPQLETLAKDILAKQSKILKRKL